MLFFFSATATTEIYTLSLHDALPIFGSADAAAVRAAGGVLGLHPHLRRGDAVWLERDGRSEEHTSELQSPVHLVCRLLLEKKKTQTSAESSALHQKTLTGMARHIAPL